MTMTKRLAQIVSLVSLVVLLVPSVLFLAGKMDLDRVKDVMLVATIIWFVATPFWMWERE
jgi:hypothetical protein